MEFNIADLNDVQLPCILYIIESHKLKPPSPLVELPRNEHLVHHFPSMKDFDHIILSIIVTKIGEEECCIVKIIESSSIELFLSSSCHLIRFHIRDMSS